MRSTFSYGGYLSEVERRSLNRQDSTAEKRKAFLKKLSAQRAADRDSERAALLAGNRKMRDVIKHQKKKKDKSFLRWVCCSRCCDRRDSVVAEKSPLAGSGLAVSGDRDPYYTGNASRI